MAHPTQTIEFKFEQLPQAYQLLIAAYETEIEQIHPGWRQKQPFYHLDLERAKRLKWLLKRRMLLYQGRDWEVKITLSADGTQCFAHPVPPQVSDRQEVGEPGPISVTDQTIAALEAALNAAKAARGAA